MNYKYKNPYIAGKPLNSDIGFVGRIDVFNKVDLFINNASENVMVLYGQRRMGKTSILMQLKRKYLKLKQNKIIYFDLQSYTNSKLNDVLIELTKIIYDSSILSKPPKIDRDTIRDEFKNVFLPAIESTNEKLILLFDEFDVLDYPSKTKAEKSLIPYFGELMWNYKNIKFIFAMGRKPEELSLNFLSILKSVPYFKIDVLSKEDTYKIIKLSELYSKSLVWNQNLLAYIWSWTKGHPFLTQLLCKTIWDRIYNSNPAPKPKVSKEDIDNSIIETLERGSHAFEWIWKGLPPAEKVILSAVSKNYNSNISDKDLENTLLNSGIHIIIRELNEAPQKLCNWGLLKKENEKYSFVVPLLGKWISNTKPLSLVKAERDHIDPLAENLYRISENYYYKNMYTDAINFLKRTLANNPNHLKAMMLLGQIYQEEQKYQDALEILERAYNFDNRSARYAYIQALLFYARNIKINDEKYEFFNKVLKIQPDNPEAKSGIKKYWKNKGNEEYERGNLRSALKAFKKTHMSKRIREIVDKIKNQEIEQITKDIDKLKNEEQWDELINMLNSVIKEYPETQKWRNILYESNKQKELSELYYNAILAIDDKKNEKAIELLIKILNLDYNYKDTIQYLVIATKSDIDINNIYQQKLDLEFKNKYIQIRNELEKITNIIKLKLIKENPRRRNQKIIIRKILADINRLKNNYLFLKD